MNFEHTERREYADSYLSGVLCGIYGWFRFDRNASQHPGELETALSSRGRLNTPFVDISGGDKHSIMTPCGS